MSKISVAIPCYEYQGHGAFALNYLLETLDTQTFKDFDVVVSDHSLNDNKQIEHLCDSWQDKMKIKYLRNSYNRGNASANFNYAMFKSDGEYIKFMCQDDYFYDEFSLEKIVRSLENDLSKNWLASKYIHAERERERYTRTHTPSLNYQIYITNTIGTPSGVTIKNFGYKLPSFDENLSYAYDCDFYYRFRGAYGDPIILNEITVVNYLWAESTTAKITDGRINGENRYILKKYGL
jgi:glycosyltransferase involved in cell wall biosynthesis